MSLKYGWDFLPGYLLGWIGVFLIMIVVASLIGAYSSSGDGSKVFLGTDHLVTPKGRKLKRADLKEAYYQDMEIRAKNNWRVWVKHRGNKLELIDPSLKEHTARQVAETVEFWISRQY